MDFCEKCKQFRSPTIKIISCTTNKERRHHSFDDLPSIQYSDGWMEWHKDGKLHRENGAALTGHSNGLNMWFYEGNAARKVKEELYLEKVFIMDEKTTMVTKKINDYFYEVLQGDQKKLVVSLDKSSEG